MPGATRIYLTLIWLIVSLFCSAQHHADVQEYNNRVLFNPSFTGTTLGKRIFGTALASRSPKTVSYTKILSADFYVPGKKLGYGITGGVRSNGEAETFSMFGETSFSKFYEIGNKQYIIPSLALGLEQPLKDLGLFMTRRLFGNVVGGKIPQPTKGILRSGLIFANYDWNAGFSGMVSQEFQLLKDTTITGDFSYRVVAHWSKTINYKLRGLMSKHYYLQPRVILDYSPDRTLVFTDFRMQRFKWTGGLALLHNIETSKTRIAGSVGYEFKTFRLSYMCSGQIPSPGFFEIIQSINLRINIPGLNNGDEPVYPLIRDI